MEKALFLNGVFDDVLEDILKSQEKYPNEVFYLQPYSAYPIKLLQMSPPKEDAPLPVYISTNSHLNQICYYAKIVGWEDKTQMQDSRRALLNERIERLQPVETDRIYLEAKGKKCVNLLEITGLRQLANQFSTSILKKINGGKPLKPRTVSGGYSYVHALPLLSLEESLVEEEYESDLRDSVGESLLDDDEWRDQRLAKAPKYPTKVQTVSYAFKRNPDVIAHTLKRAAGICELCKQPAPFLTKKRHPYLEVHHWNPLANGGEDSVDNAAALCPNCHKQAHHGQHQTFIKRNRSLPKEGICSSSKTSLEAWKEGTVDPNDEHFELRYGSSQKEGWDEWLPAALVGAPVDGISNVCLLIDKNAPSNGQVIEAVENDIQFYLVDKMERDPWSYAKYHCGTKANEYSKVHWSFFEKNGR